MCRSSNDILVKVSRRQALLKLQSLVACNEHDWVAEVKGMIITEQEYKTKKEELASEIERLRYPVTT